MQGFAVHGIDVSHYQSTIDWSEVAVDSIDFAFIKASEGLEMKDEFFQQNWTGSKEAGIIHGAYHFFIPGSDAEKQAQNFIEAVSLSKGDLPPVLDVEVSGSLPRNQLLNGIRKWLKTIEAKYNTNPIIYTNQNFYTKYLEDEFDDYVIWVARYSTNQPDTGIDWKFWQYAQDGMVRGVTGDIDLNVFHGNIQSLRALCLGEQLIL